MNHEEELISEWGRYWREGEGRDRTCSGRDSFKFKGLKAEWFKRAGGQGFIVVLSVATCNQVSHLPTIGHVSGKLNDDHSLSKR